MKKCFKRIVYIVVLGTLSLSGAEPKIVFETTYEVNASGGIIDNKGGPVGKLGPGSKIVESALGKAIETSGVINNGATFPASAALEFGTDFSYSGWFLIKEFAKKDSEKPYRSQTLMNRGGSWRVNVPERSAGFQTYIEKQLFMLRCAPRLYQANEWVHIAFIYSVTEKKYALLLNGITRSLKTTSIRPNKIPPPPAPSKGFFQIGSLANYFPTNGYIGRFRAYEGVLTVEKINTDEQDIARKIASSVKKELTGVAGSEALLKFIENAEKKKVFPLQIIGYIQKEKGRLLKFAEFRKSGKSANDFIAYSVLDPLGITTYYSDSTLPEEGMNGKILIAAALNEFEPASFILKPLQDIKDFKPVMEPLKSADGKTIPPSAIDIRLVKETLRRGRIFQPNVLLYDDALIKVDREKKDSWIRLNTKDGIKYHSLTADDKEKMPLRKKWSVERFPIYDAKTLQALDLKAGINQQYWLTLKTEPSMAPGLYESKIKLMAGKKEIGSIPIKARILPFELPEPKTNYDLGREFTTSGYFYDNIYSGTKYAGAGAVNYLVPLNEEQFKAYLKNLYDHGIRHPTIIMGNYFPRWYSYFGRNRANRKS